MASSYAGLIYISLDSGATWTRANAPGDAWWLNAAASADGSKLVAVGVGGSYGDSGHAYTLQFPLPLLSLPRLSISPLSGGTGLSRLVPSSRSVLQQNPDLTTTNWTDVLVPPTLNFTNLIRSVAVSPSLGSRFYRLKQQ